MGRRWIMHGLGTVLCTLVLFVWPLGSSRAADDIVELDVSYPRVLRDHVLQLIEMLDGTAHDASSGARLRSQPTQAPPQPPSVLPTVAKVLAAIDEHPAELHTLGIDVGKPRTPSHLLVKLSAPKTPAWWDRWALGCTIADTMEAGGMPLRSGITTVDLTNPYRFREAPVREHLIELRSALSDVPAPSPPEPMWTAPSDAELRATIKSEAKGILAFLAPERTHTVDRVWGRSTVRGTLGLVLPKERAGDLAAIVRLCSHLERAHRIRITGFWTHAHVDFAKQAVGPPIEFSLTWTRVRTWRLADVYNDYLVSASRKLGGGMREAARVRLAADRLERLVRLLHVPGVTCRRHGTRDVLRPTSPQATQAPARTGPLLRALAEVFDVPQYRVHWVGVHDELLAIQIEERLDPSEAAPWREERDHIEERMKAHWEARNGAPVFRELLADGVITDIRAIAKDDQDRATRARIALTFRWAHPRPTATVAVAPKRESGDLEDELGGTLAPEASIQMIKEPETRYLPDHGLTRVEAKRVYVPEADRLSAAGRVLNRLEAMPGVSIRTVDFLASRGLVFHLRYEAAFFADER